MKKTILYSLFFLPVSLFAQEHQIDSLQNALKTAKQDTNRVKILNSIAANYLQVPPNYKKALPFAEESLALSKQLNYKKGLARAYNNLGLIYGYFGFYTKALNSYLNKLKIWEALKDSAKIIESYYNLSSQYSLQKNYGKALETDLMINKIVEANKNENDLMTMSWRLRTDYFNICKKAISRSDSISANYNYTKAIEFALKAKNLAKEMGDSNNIAFFYNCLGYIYDKCNLCDQSNMLTGTRLIKANLYDSAKNEFLASVEIYKKLNNKEGILTSYISLGLFHRNQGDLLVKTNRTSAANNNYKKSLQYYLQAFKGIKELGYKHGLASFNKEVGTAYLKLGNTKNAEPHLLNAAIIFKEIGYKEGAKESYELLSNVALKNQNYKKAFEYYRDFSNLKDSLINEESVKQLTEMEIKYETEKKDLKIKISKQEIEEEKKNNKYLMLGTIASVMILIFISYLLVNMRKQNKALAKERVATSNLMGIMRHETARQFSNLSLSLQKILSVKEPKLQVNKAIVEVKSKALLYSSLFMSEGKALISFKKSVEELFIYNYSRHLIDKDIKFEVTGDLDITINGEEYLFEYLNELISNSLEHAFQNIVEPVIKISIEQTKDNITIEYYDNGCGITNFHKLINPGKGMYYIKLLAEDNMNARLKTDFSSGSKFILILPANNAK